MRILGLLAVTALGASGLASAASMGGERYCQHYPRDLSYTDSGKPMSKRRKRRMRGKAKEN